MYIVFYIITLLLIPIFDVILKNIKNILNWRKLLNLFQTYFDLIKLFKKSNFSSEFTSFISFLSPFIILFTSLIFLFFIPTVSIFININIFVLFHILGLWSVFLMIYALDNSTYFWGLWASREAFVLSIVEPVTILFILFLIVLSNWNMDLLSISNFLNSNTDIIISFFIFILSLILFTILLAENKRFPFDNPSTHLELTMIHEAMLLETTGIKLAIMEISSKINLIAFVNLIIFFVWNNTYWLVWNLEFYLLYLLKVILILTLVWFVEVFITKMRLFKYQNIFGFLLILELITISFYFLNNL